MKIVNTENIIYQNEGCNYENILKNKNEIEKRSKECQFRKVRCLYSKKLLKAFLLKSHEENECPEIMVKCQKCFSYMSRRHFNFTHKIKDNIECLKLHVEYDKSKSKSSEIDSPFYKNEIYIIETKRNQKII